VRISSEAELERLDRLSERFGPRLLVLVRALPVLAEASVLLFGATRLSWRRFLLPVALANLGIAAAYSVFGYFGRTENVTFYVLAASVALPLLATTMVRWRAPK
jgi:membrane protein DedA with SNARE-associated domain